MRPAILDGKALADRLPNGVLPHDSGVVFRVGTKMMSSSQTEKVAGRCRNCDRHTAAPDNFCRWCGFHYSDAALSTAGETWQTSSTTVMANIGQRQTSKTTVLEQNEVVSQSLSKLSLDMLSQSVAAKTEPLKLNRYGALVVAVLIAIPMWLLIVLLSPFDAYVSAKSAWAQMQSDN